LIESKRIGEAFPAIKVDLDSYRAGFWLAQNSNSWHISHSKDILDECQIDRGRTYAFGVIPVKTGIQIMIFYALDLLRNNVRDEIAEFRAAYREG